MTVAFKELGGSPYESFGPDGPKARREILVAWSDRMAMVRELLGDSEEFGGNKQLAYPDWTDVVAVRIKVEAFPPAMDPQDDFDDIATQINNYTAVADQRFAKLTVEYELFATQVTGGFGLPTPEENTFLSYHIAPSAEGLKIPTGNLQWQDEPAEPTPKEGGAMIRVPIIEHHLTWHRVARVPGAAIRNCIGRTNNAAFMGAPAGSVLFDAPTLEREFTTFNTFNSGTWAWRVGYIFLERYPAWVKTYRASPNTAPDWDILQHQTVAGLVPATYEEADFSSLFKYEQVAD